MVLLYSIIMSVRVFIDNILFRGYLYKESPKRFKTIVKRLDDFIDYLYENFDSVMLLPISDGVMLVSKERGDI